jgi:hypothetical protein
VVRCNNCARGLNSAYVRVGTKGQASKIGYYCAPCDCYYSPNLEKLYTENSKLCTVSNNEIMSSVPTEHKQEWAGMD